MNVQHGYCNNIGTFDIAISAVNTTKSFLKINSDQWQTGFGGSNETRGEIFNSTTVRFYFSSSAQANWEVVTLD